MGEGIGATGIRLSNGAPLDKMVDAALATIKSHPKLRQVLIGESTSAVERMNSHNWGNNKNRAAGLHFLIKALGVM